MAREGQGQALLRVDSLLRSALAVSLAGTVQVALRAAALCRRYRVHRLTSGPTDRVSREQPAARSHHRDGARRSRRSIESARREHARVLHLPGDHPRAIHHSRPLREDARAARGGSGAHGGSAAHGARSPGCASSEGHRRRQSGAAAVGCEAVARPRRVRRGPLPAPSLRLVGVARLARRSIQGDRRAAPGTLRPRQGSARNDQPLRGTKNGSRRDAGPAARAGERRGRCSRRHPERARGRPRSACAAGRARLRRIVCGYRVGSPHGSRGPERQDLRLQPDDRVTRDRERQGLLRARGRDAQPGRQGRPEGDRRLVQPGERSLQGRPLRGGHQVLLEGARTQARLRSGRRQPGERVPQAGPR